MGMQPGFHGALTLRNSGAGFSLQGGHFRAPCRADTGSASPSPCRAQEAPGQGQLLVSEGLPCPQEERQRGGPGFPLPSALSRPWALVCMRAGPTPPPTPGQDKASSHSCSLPSRNRNRGPSGWGGVGAALAWRIPVLEPRLFLCRSASKKPILNLMLGYFSSSNLQNPRASPG